MGQGRVLLTGAAGLLGTWLLKSAAPSTEIVALTHRRAVEDVHAVRADLRSATDAAAALSLLAPSLVIHAAYENDRASIVDATRNLVDGATAVGADVVYISTDAVFRGDGEPRDERSVPDPGWDYGRWKAAAERIVLDADAAAAVIRLPLLVSIDPDDHVVRRIREAAADGTSTRWFTDERRRPAWASEIAAAIWRIVALPVPDRRGCWHLAGPERLSRFEIAQRVIERLQLSRSVIEPARQPRDTDRPRDLAFTDERARAVIGWSPSPIA